MKVFLSKMRDHVGGVNGILLMIYVFLIRLTGVFTREVVSPAYILITCLTVGILCFLLCPPILRFFSKLELTGPEKGTGRTWKQKLLTFFTFLVIPLLCFLLLYIVFYPGSYSVDSLDQYTQAITNEYNDWHPVLHTLLFFKLPLALTRGWVGSIVLFQVLIFSAVLAYAFYVICKYAGRKFTVVCMAFVLLNPQLQVIALFPWKDAAFTICAVLLLAFCLQIYFSKGIWVQHPINTAVFVITIVCTTLIRHNAVLFTLPLALAVLLCVTKTRGLIIAVSAIVLFAGIKFPLYSMLNVETPDQRQVETLGLPMTVIGTVVTHAPEALDEETREFAYQVTPKEVWEEKFQDGSYNSVKWDPRTDNQVIEEYGALKVISMMLRCFKTAPRQALCGLIKLTEGVYSITVPSGETLVPYILGNNYGITQTGNEHLKELCLGYFFSMHETLSHVFTYLGIMHLLLLTSVLSKCKLNKPADWKRILFVLPVFVYNFGSSLLLTGADDIQRFFLYTFPVTPLLLLFIFYQNNERNTDISVTEVV